MMDSRMPRREPETEFTGASLPAPSTQGESASSHAGSFDSFADNPLLNEGILSQEPSIAGTSAVSSRSDLMFDFEPLDLVLPS